MGLDFIMGLATSRTSRPKGTVSSTLPPLTVDGNVDGIADSWTLTVGTPANTPITPTVSGSGQLLTLATSTGAGTVTLATTVAAASMSNRSFSARVTAVQSGTYAAFRIRLEFINASSSVIQTVTTLPFTVTGTARQFSLLGFKSPTGTASVRMSFLADVAGAGVSGGITFTGAILGWQ